MKRYTNNPTDINLTYAELLDHYAEKHIEIEVTRSIRFKEYVPVPSWFFDVKVWDLESNDFAILKENNTWTEAVERGMKIANDILKGRNGKED